MIYSCLYSHRHVVYIVYILVAAFSMFGIFNLKLENNGLVFIPDSRADLKEASRILSTSPAANMLFVDVEGENPLLAVNMIERAVPASLAQSMTKQIRDVTPEALIRAFPLFFTPELENKLDAKLKDGGLEKLMEGNKRMLGGFGSISISDWIRTDPLQLRLLLRDSLPSGMNLFNNSISPDGRHALLMLKPTGNAFNTESSKELINLVKSGLPEGYSLRMSGAPLHTAYNTEAVQKDLLRIVIWSIIGFSGAYILIARSWGAIWILMTALVATGCAVAATGFFWQAASGIAIGFGASLMGLAEDYAVHMHFALRSSDKQKQVYDELEKPLFQSFLLNSSGFVVLLFSSIPAIRQMAFFAVVSLSTGYLMATTLLPFIPSFTRPRNIREKLEQVKKKPSIKREAAALVLLAGACVLLYDNINFDFLPRSLGARGDEIFENTEIIRETWNIEPAVSVIVNGKDKEDALKKAGRLAEELRAKGAKEVISPSDFIFTASDGAENAARWKRWLERENVEERLIKAGVDQGFGQKAFEPFFAAVAMLPQTIDGPANLLMFDNSAIVRCEEIPAGFDLSSPDVHVFRPAGLEATIAENFSKETRLIGAAALICAGLAWLLLRKWRRIMAVFIPPLFSVTSIFLVFNVLNIPFNLAALAALPIVFGLALDHGIMITHALRFREALGVRRAIIMASITAFFSIGLLSLSDHPALRSMGVVIFSGLVGELVAALWIVPLLYPKIRGKS